MQMIGQEMPLRQRASQSFNDFYRYFKERFPNVSAAPSQVKAMLEVGKRKWRGEPVSPELRQAAWKGVGYSLGTAILAAVAFYFTYQKVVKPYQFKLSREKLERSADEKETLENVIFADDLDSKTKEELARFMIAKRHMDVNEKKGRFQETLLFKAIAQNDVSAVRLLLKLKADPNVVRIATHDFGPTPLLYAIDRGSRDPEIIDLLLQHKADPNMESRYNMNALHLAILRYDLIEKDKL